MAARALDNHQTPPPFSPAKRSALMSLLHEGSVDDTSWSTGWHTNSTRFKRIPTEHAVWLTGIWWLHANTHICGGLWTHNGTKPGFVLPNILQLITINRLWAENTCFTWVKSWISKKWFHYNFICDGSVEILKKGQQLEQVIPHDQNLKVVLSCSKKKKAFLLHISTISSQYWLTISYSVVYKIYFRYEFFLLPYYIPHHVSSMWSEGWPVPPTPGLYTPQPTQAKVDTKAHSEHSQNTTNNANIQNNNKNKKDLNFRYLNKTDQHIYTIKKNLPMKQHTISD